MSKNILSKLPKKASLLWKATYKNARAKGNDETSASKIATLTLKKVYIKKKGMWIRKHLKIKSHLIKSGWLFPSYKFEFELANDKWDSDNQRVTKQLLSKIVNNNLIDSIGDVDHERYYRNTNSIQERNLINQDQNTEGLYYLDSYKLENGSLKAIVGMNKNHVLFNKYLNEHQKGNFLYASAEYPEAEVVDGEIVDAKEMLWSITSNPAGDVSAAKAI